MRIRRWVEEKSSESRHPLIAEWSSRDLPKNRWGRDVRWSENYDRVYLA